MTHYKYNLPISLTYLILPGVLITKYCTSHVAKNSHRFFLTRICVCFEIGLLPHKHAGGINFTCFVYYFSLHTFPSLYQCFIHVFIALFPFCLFFLFKNFVFSFWFLLQICIAEVLLISPKKLFRKVCLIFFPFCMILVIWFALFFVFCSKICCAFRNVRCQPTPAWHGKH